MLIPLYNADGVAIRTFAGLDAAEWAAVGTVLCAVLTLFLWFVAIRTLKDSRRMFAVINSPHIGIDKIILTKKPLGNKGRGVAIQFSNSGVTVANDVILMGRQGNSELHLRDGKLHNLIFPLSLGPKEASHQFTSIPEPLISDSISGEDNLFVRYEIYYTGLDGELYLNYFYGLYNKEFDTFSSLEAYNGKVSQTNLQIAKEFWTKEELLGPKQNIQNFVAKMQEAENERERLQKEQMNKLAQK